MQLRPSPRSHSISLELAPRDLSKLSQQENCETSPSKIAAKLKIILYQRYDTQEAGASSSDSSSRINEPVDVIGIDESLRK